jgi:hypothetical protein
MTGSFLREPPVSPGVQALYDEDLADDGYVANLSRLWAHQPDTLERLFELMSQAFTRGRDLRPACSHLMDHRPRPRLARNRV